MILQFLLNYFLTEYKNGEFKPLYDLLEANDFDLISALKNAKPQDFAPLLRTFFERKNQNKSAPEDCTFGGVEPIKNFADSEIVSTLNAYFSCPI